MKKYFSLLFFGLLSLFFTTFFSSCVDEEVAFPTGTLVTISELNTNYDKYDGEIIRLENVQFTPADTNKAFNGGVGNGTGSRNLQECSTGSTVVVFTAANSDFTNLKTPTGKGYFVGKASKFGTTVQILLLDRNSFQNMTGERCTPGTGGGGGNTTATTASILQVRDLATTNTLPYTITQSWKIKGIVTSDKDGGNMNNQNMYIQNPGGKAILARFTTAHTFVLGDEVEINVTGATLGKFAELLQVSNIVLANATKTGTGTITPIIVSVAQLAAGNNESELVTVQNVAFTNAGNPYRPTATATNQPITQASASVSVFSGTGVSTTWANKVMPSGNVNVTGNASVSNAIRQILPRNVSELP
jgi:trimeric autotransporter adhesin